MNIDSKKIKKKLNLAYRLIRNNIKEKHKEIYKRKVISKTLLSFLIFYAYWLHKKMNVELKTSINLLDSNSIITKYLYLIFDNKDIRILLFKSKNINFLKSKLFDILKTNSSDLIKEIYQLLNNTLFNMDKNINREFANLYLYFIILNNMVPKVSSNMRENLKDVDEYNRNIEVYLYSLEQFKNARSLFEKIDRENLSDMTIVMTLLTKNLLS